MFSRNAPQASCDLRPYPGRENAVMPFGLFVPGWGAPARLYLAALPDSWQVLEPPSFRRSGGRLDVYRDWLAAELAAREAPVVLAGHSMGAVLAVLTALDRPERIERLILVSPAGLPLQKSLRASALTAAGQILRGCYPVGALLRMLANTTMAPRAALELAHTVRELDLTPQLQELRARHIPCTVIGCRSDQLTTSAHCRQLATLLAADYRELDAADGHIWMITRPELLRSELTRTPGPS